MSLSLVLVLVAGLIVLGTIIYLTYLYVEYGWPYTGMDINTWTIGIYAGNSPVALQSPQGVSNPVLTAQDITDTEASFIADPFLINEDGLWYMFFEVVRTKENRGDIGVATSEDGLTWRYKQIVLSESFHLSYPHVFKWKDEFYMIPESKGASSVRLYKADNFPTGWSYMATMLEGKFIDSSVFFYQDRWWMLTSNPKKTLRLFFTDDLLAPWTEHPKSPLYKKDPFRGRMGGRVVMYNDHLLRFAQDIKFVYGNEVRAFKIIKLTPTEYEEQPVRKAPVLRRSGTGWSCIGMHHVDPQQVDKDKWIAAVDGFGRKNQPSAKFGGNG
jgi:hypothetical protein